MTILHCFWQAIKKWVVIQVPTISMKYLILSKPAHGAASFLHPHPHIPNYYKFMREKITYQRSVLLLKQTPHSNNWKHPHSITNSIKWGTKSKYDILRYLWKASITLKVEKWNHKLQKVVEEKNALNIIQWIYIIRQWPGQSASQGVLLEALEASPPFAWQQPDQSDTRYSQSLLSDF